MSTEEDITRQKQESIRRDERKQKAGEICSDKNIIISASHSLDSTVGSSYAAAADTQSRLTVLRERKEILKQNLAFVKAALSSDFTFPGNTAGSKKTADDILDERRKELIEVNDRLEVLTHPITDENGKQKLEIENKWHDYQDRKSKHEAAAKKNADLKLPEVNEEKEQSIANYQQTVKIEKDILELENDLKSSLVELSKLESTHENIQKMDAVSEYLELSYKLNEYKEIFTKFLKTIGMVESDTQKYESKLALNNWRSTVEKLVAPKFNLPLKKVEFSELIQAHLEYRKLFSSEVQDPNGVTKNLFEKLENKMTEEFEKQFLKSKSPEEKMVIINEIAEQVQRIDFLAIELPPNMNNHVLQFLLTATVTGNTSLQGSVLGLKDKLQEEQNNSQPLVHTSTRGHSL